MEILTFSDLRPYALSADEVEEYTFAISSLLLTDEEELDEEEPVFVIAEEVSEINFSLKSIPRLLLLLIIEHKETENPVMVTSDAE